MLNLDPKNINGYVGLLMALAGVMLMVVKSAHIAYRNHQQRVEADRFKKREREKRDKTQKNIGRRIYNSAKAEIKKLPHAKFTIRRDENKDGAYCVNLFQEDATSNHWILKKNNENRILRVEISLRDMLAPIKVYDGDSILPRPYRETDEEVQSVMKRIKLILEKCAELEAVS